MADLLIQNFNLRRPLLQYVAASLSQQFAEVISDSQLSATVAFAVVTHDRFGELVKERGANCAMPLVEIVEQISGRIDVCELEHVNLAEKLIGDSVSIAFAAWLSEDQAKSPIRKLHCVIPPQAKPDGWSGRPDVPNAFELLITVKPQAAEGGKSTETRLSRPAHDGVPNRALIMEGGGVKGLAFVGALEVLSVKYNFDWYVGTSAGAITAVFLAAGFTTEEMTRILRQKNFGDFFDAKRWYHKLFNFAVYHGFHEAKTFTDWVDELLAEKLDSVVRVRMEHITEKTDNRLTLYASRKGKPTLTFDSVGAGADSDAAFAARCSMSIPYVFTPQYNQGIRTYDGGVKQNYPVQQLLDDHPGTDFVAFYLGPEKYEPDKNHIVTLDLYSLILEPNDAELVEKYKDRTVIIDTRPVGVLDFELTNDEKEYLLACGRAGAHRMLDKNSAECARAIAARDALKHTVQAARDKEKSAKRTRRFWKTVLAIAMVAGLYFGWNYITSFVGWTSSAVFQLLGLDASAQWTWTLLDPVTADRCQQG